MGRNGSGSEASSSREVFFGTSGKERLVIEAVRRIYGCMLNESTQIVRKQD
jgi:hypothetical protein